MPSFSEGEVFWCSIWENIGDEECGKGDDFSRPVLIVRKFNKQIFLWVPLSTKIKENNIFYTRIVLHGEDVSAMISQIRIFDAKRLEKRMWELSKDDYNSVMMQIKEIVFKNFAPKL